MKKQMPILFSTMMVQAELAGRKTMTRRVINPQPELRCFKGNVTGNEVLGWQIPGTSQFWQPGDSPETSLMKTPYGQPGDILYVREEYYHLGHWEQVAGVKTKGGRMKWKFVPDSEEISFEEPATYRKGRHHKDPHTPAIHKRLARFMPKKYARIWLEVTGILVERLQEISEEDAIAEGLAKITKDGGRTWKYGIPDKDGYPGNDDYGWPWSEWCTNSREAYFKLWEKINGRESLEANPWVWVVSYRILSTTGKPAGLEKEVAG